MPCVHLLSLLIMYLVRSRSSLGFTLIELILTLAVVAILATVAVPGFQVLIKNNRISSQTNELLAALRLVRSEAIKRAAVVSLCKRNKAGAACDAAASWRDGWLAFVNDDGDRPAQVDAGERILRVYGELSGGNTLSGGGNFRNFISYSAVGASSNLGTFTLCDDRGPDHALAVIISRTGRARTSQTKSNGDPLDCPAP